MKVLLDDSDLDVKSLGKEVSLLTFEDFGHKAQEALKLVGVGVFFDRKQEFKGHKIIYPS
jgi:hypothetical protein